jgi:hypothetical protein
VSAMSFQRTPATNTPTTLIEPKLLELEQLQGLSRGPVSRTDSSTWSGRARARSRRGCATRIEWCRAHPERPGTA